MLRHNTNEDGIKPPTIKSAAEGPSSVSAVVDVRQDTIHSGNAVAVPRFSHLTSRIFRDWQRFGQHVNDMPYFGTPLDDKGSIRLLVLKPGAIDDAVICELSAARIDNLPQFEALSYTWGNPEERTPITITGEEFRVTANLAAPLRHIRYLDRPRLLWVDALCINQRDAIEVNTQIRHMVDIYGSASRVIAWLGPDDGSIHAAFDAIRTVSNTISPEEVDLLTSLFSRPYWTRLWVVQELVLSKDVQFVCGREYLSWKIADRFFRPAPSSGKTPFDTLPPALRNITYRLRHIWHGREIITGDYVYLLLGLATPSTAVHQLVRPDYTGETSTEEVYRDATAAAIIEDQNLNILYLVRRYSDQNTANTTRPLPFKTSWVGDWSCVRVIRPLIEPDNTDQLYSVYQSGNFSEEDNLLHKDLGILKTSGVIFDTIDIVKSQVDPLALEWEDDVRSWEPPDIQTYQYPTGEDQVDAFWRTLILDDGFAPFHKVHARLTPQQKDEYRELYLQWRYGTIESAKSDSRSFAQCIQWSPSFNTLYGWAFAATKKGYFARLQPDTVPGDVIVLLRGGAIPFILRPVSIPDLGGKGDVIHGGSAWRLIGTAYVHGIMDGEAIASGTLLTEQNFYLV